MLDNVALFAFQFSFYVTAAPLSVIAYHVLPFPVSFVVLSVNLWVELLCAELLVVLFADVLNPTTFGVFAGPVIVGAVTSHVVPWAVPLYETAIVQVCGVELDSVALFAFQLAFNVIASPLAVMAYHKRPFPVSSVVLSVNLCVELLCAELFVVSVEFKLKPITFGVFDGAVIVGAVTSHVVPCAVPLYVADILHVCAVVLDNVAPFASHLAFNVTAGAVDCA